MPRFLAPVEYDADAKAFGVAIPDCLGCTAMGLTFEDTEANAIEALREWAVDRRAGGHDLPRPRDIAELRMDPSLFDVFTERTIVMSLPI